MGVLAVTMGAWWVIVPLVTHGQSTSKAPAAASRSVSVVAAPARKGNMPVYLTGLGTVTALQTVTVKSRVDGQLINVAFREGQFVYKGDLLVELDPRPFRVQLEQAEGQAAKDEAVLKNARVDLDRYRVLVEENSIPRQQLDTQVATVAQGEAAIRSDQAQIASASLNLTYARITAPISGRVGLRLVDVGNMVHATDQNGLVVITQVQPIAIVFTLPEDSLGQILPKVRAGARLPVEAYDRDLVMKLASGRLLSVDNQIDQTTGTVKLKAEFDNADEELFPNQFVNARLLVDTLRDAVIVPNAAIQRSSRSAFVYLVKPDHTVEARDVAVRATEGDQAALASGVAAGDMVVTDGLDRLQPGTKVDIRRSGASDSAEPAP